MKKQDVMKLQTCVLRVNIHCDGCKQKVKKLLQKIDGVYSTKIDAEQGRVTVTGNVDPSMLVKKLCKSGKHAELWNTGGASGGHKGLPNLNAQFKNLRMDNGKMGNSNKPKGGGADNHHHQQQQQQPKTQLTPQQFQQLQQMMMMKGGGTMDMKMMPPAPSEDKKSVKFDKGNHHDDDFDDHDDYDDDDDDLDDDFDDSVEEFDDGDEDEEDEEGFGRGPGGQGHHHPLPNKMMMPMMGNSNKPNGHNPMMMMKGFPMDDKKGGENAKKGCRGGGGFNNLVQLKSMGRKDEGKHGNAGKKGFRKGQEDGTKNVADHIGCGGKSKNGSGGLLGFFKKAGGGKNGSGGKKGNKGNSAGGNIGNGSTKGGSKAKDININMNMKKKHGSQDIDELMDLGKKGKKVNNNGSGHNGGASKGMGQFGPMGPQLGQQFNPHPPMGNFPKVQGLPMNGGGYLPMAVRNGPMTQQQQYVQMMMNQQQGAAAAAAAAYGGAGAGGDMYQPMMYARPYPAANYAHPPPMHGPHPDSYTHYFSDENTESCSIM